MDLIDRLHALGLINQVSQEDELKQHLGSGMRTVYCGFDPTADSLHIGNLVPLLSLRRFQQAGHRPILLVGGATGMIGDPGGRTSERDLKPEAEVRAFVTRIREQAEAFLDFDCGANSAIVVNNADWTEGLSVIEYLRDIGKHFSVNAMVQKDTVRRRLEDDSQGISYTEFSYMILQSYDYVVLNREHDCTIQLGGSDQWGNITSGMDLIRRMAGNQAFAVTFPLLTRADGAKMGKSADGAIWLDPARTSPYKFYQYWLNSLDDDVIRFIKVFTFLDLEEIEHLAQAHADNPGARVAHRALAAEVTRLVHGDTGKEAAERISAALFANNLTELTESDLEQLAQDGMPSSPLANDGKGILDVLVTSGLAVTPKGEVTRGQARKLIQGNAVSVNGVKVTDDGMELDTANALYGRFHLVQKGKKNHHLVYAA